MPSTETLRYTRTAVFLHLLIALSIIGMLILGWSLDDFAPENRGAAFMWHKSIGLTILLLSLFRLFWRATHQAPPLPETMPKWEQCAAHFGHTMLYFFMIAMPLSGWALSSAGGHPIMFYGLFHWPDVPFLATLENKKEIAHKFDDFHKTSALILAFLVAGHAAAALKHHFYNKDEVLLRIMPRFLSCSLNKLRGK